MHRHLIVFDFDGPLREVSWEATFHGFVAMCEATGVYWRKHFVDLDAFIHWYSPDWKKSKDELLLGTGVVWEEATYEIFRAVYNAEVAVLANIPALLPQLAKCATLAVFSSAQRKTIHEALGPLAQHFVHILAEEDVTKLKPDPEGALKILAATGHSPRDAVMIGDTEVDIEAGKRAGMRTIGVTWGLRRRHPELLVNAKPDLIWHDPSEYVNLLDPKFIDAFFHTP